MPVCEGFLEDEESSLLDHWDDYLSTVRAHIYIAPDCFDSSSFELSAAELIKFQE